MFVLWPLYSRSIEENTYRYSILWPFFSYSTGGEDALAFWPFYGKIITPGKSEKHYVLWPIYNYQKLGLDTDNPPNFKNSPALLRPGNLPGVLPQEHPVSSFQPLSPE